ncbi:MAG: peptide MFS transporter [Bacteroidales bacterium]|nr:peptide MFS transporter [Bacteroidales bacterium]
MFKGHPKGLIAAALANMGERFGFYTMMAILVLFLQAKFGLNGEDSGYIYSTFYALIYVLSLVGGIIADRTGKYKGTIMTGLIVMSLGYVMMSIPSAVTSDNRSFLLIMTIVSLFTIAFGNGLFKGNLQALVGQMYDNPKYTAMRDSGFSLFYMFINVGAIFAPFTAVGVRNWWLGDNGFGYNADLPELCHAYNDGTISEAATQSFQKMADTATLSGQPVADLGVFADTYLNVFVTGFHYAFAVAIGAMAISFLVWIMNKKSFPNPQSSSERAEAAAKGEVTMMDIKEVKQRMYALFAVFGVVIFFWFSFHQNGLTLTFFAKDYTDLSIMSVNIFGTQIQGAELFQSINPFFVVFLTPIIVGLFGWLRNRGIEPSTPKKIAIGMGIASLGFVIMTMGSMDLPLFSEISPKVGGTPLDQALKVTPFLLLGTYFVLTVAELFISPLGISFVSKVAPPQYQGLMQGMWLGATAVGNQLLFIGAILYESIPIWMTWTVFVGATAMSMFMMLFMVKWLERVAKD